MLANCRLGTFDFDSQFLTMLHDMELIGKVAATEDDPAKVFYVCTVQAIEEIAQTITPTSPHFCLFVAVDARTVSDASIVVMAEQLIKKGLVYACTWGPDCERVHDQIDAARNPDETDANVIVTTWHSDETLRKAAWFFAYAACPADDYLESCTDWIAVHVGNPEWGLTISKVLSGATQVYS